MRFGNTTILVGPNGSGKTIELEALANQEYEKLKFVPSRRHETSGGVGFARQGRATPFLAPTVIGSLASALVLRGRSLAESYLLADELLMATRMSYIRDRKFRYLSGGEAQLVNVLSALLSTTKTLILDDPFSMLDEEHRSALLQVLHGIAKYAPSRGISEADIVIALNELPKNNTELSWIHSRDMLTIHIPVEESVKAAIATLFDLGQHLARVRRSKSTIELEEFSVGIFPSRKPLFLPITTALKQGVFYELRSLNGVGKSMALAALSGIGGVSVLHALLRSVTLRVYPRLVLHGKATWHGEFGRGSIVYIPQHCEMLTTVEGAYEEFSYLLDRLGAQNRHRYEDALQAIGIKEHRIGECSFGEARFISAIVGLLGALAHEDVSWVFLDEVDSRLDPLRRDFVRKLISLYLECGGGIVLATHTEDLTPEGEKITLTKI
jgi:energy-coupling factor transporter ATP-binding protein EcfA2